MKAKLAALILVAVIVLTSAVYYFLSASPNLKRTLPSASPTPVSFPTAPSKHDVFITQWGDPRVSYPTELTIIFPENLTYQENYITIRVNVTTSFWVITSVYYKADWLDGNYHQIYSLDPKGGLNIAISLKANFTGIPEGNHTLSLVANYHDGSHAWGAASFMINTPAVS